MVNAYSTPALLYGVETGCLGSVQIDKLDYAYNSIFTKIFNTFDREVIKLCQYYTGHMPLGYTIDLRCLQFFNAIRSLASSPAKLLFLSVGYDEWQTIADIYGILFCDKPNSFRPKIWSSFESCLVV